MNTTTFSSKDNRAFNEVSSTRKRVFSESLLVDNNMSKEQQEKEILEALENCLDNSEKDNTPSSKRTRRGSPMVSPKAIISNLGGELDNTLLPIIVDAKLPDPKETKVEPDEYLAQLVKAQFGISLKVRNGLELAGEGDYFKPVTDEQQAAYTMEVLTPARDNNVAALKELVEKKGRQSVDCVNRFGESLLNLACRRGFTEVAEFLLSKEIGLNVRTKDDFGRTCLHDAMWHPTPLLDICGWLIEKDPSLLLVADKRGNTPFQYARSEDWPTWRQFLFDHREALQLLTEPSTLKRFGGC